MTKTILVATMIMFLSFTGFIACNKKDKTQPVNDAPVATGVTVTGTAEVNKILTATYTYSDAEGDTESGSTFKWYRTDDATGTGEVVIADSVATTYTLQEEDAGKYIRFGVTPKASAGTILGTEVKSSAIGAIGEATTVTFTYNGQEVIYGIVNSAKTGKKWLDRNLGASSVPTAVDDYVNYGDLFQWGRSADGHQLITRAGDGTATITTATTTLASSANPSHALFILSGPPPSDWLSTQNADLWQGEEGINNPCPDGWRLPTQEEWDAEEISNTDDGYAKLKVTLTGERFAGFDGYYGFTASSGYYWTSTINTVLDATRSISVSISSSTYTPGVTNRANGRAIRCIKD